MKNWLYENSAWDPELLKAINDERQKQEDYISLIASENYITPRLMRRYQSALIFTNKYAEGYPGKRYYGGCAYVDDVEKLAIHRAKQLFGAAYANVQPHSGSQANAAVLMALLKPNDVLLGMKLSHGGHLTHGATISSSGYFYHAVSYGVTPEGWIDYGEVERLAKAHLPKVIIAGCSAYSRIIDWSRFRAIADEVGAYLVADIAHIAGLVATGLHPSPIAVADVVTTTTHKTLRGPRGGLILAGNAEFAVQHKLDRAVFPGTQGGPLVHTITAKAAAFYEALEPSFIEYHKDILKNSKAMVRELQTMGVKIITGDTDNHLLLVDLSAYQRSGKMVEAELERAHIISNKNMIPNDLRSAQETTGLRLGTAAITTRGLKAQQVRQLAKGIASILDCPTQTVIANVCEEVKSLCRAFPIYQTT